MVKKIAYFFDLDNTLILTTGEPHKQHTSVGNPAIQELYKTLSKSPDADVFIITGRAERMRELTDDEICRLVYRPLIMAKKVGGRYPRGCVSKSTALQEFIRDHANEYSHFFIIDDDPEACEWYK